MAIFHFHVTQISRGKGQTAVSAAAYRAGEKLHDDYYGEDPDYTKKGGVIHSEIILPKHVPSEYEDRETLWNAVETAEANNRAQLAYSFDFALPNELSDEDNLVLARKFVLENFTSRGMISDIAIHKPGKHPGDIPNPHVHVLVPMRPMNEDGTWGTKQKREYVLDENGERIKGQDGKYLFNAVKTTDWSDVKTLEQWRENWAKAVNEALEEEGFSQRVDHRSNEKRGLDELPTIHEGVAVRAMEKRGIRTEKGEWNRYIKSINRAIQKLRSFIGGIIETIEKIRKELATDNQPPLLGDLIATYYDRRNVNAYSQKAKINNLKEQARLVNFLSERKIFSLEELQNHVTATYEELGECQSKIREVEQKLKVLQDQEKYYEMYRTNLPVYEKLSSIKSPKKAEQFKNQHDGELRIFYMARRELAQRKLLNEAQEKGFLSRVQKEISVLMTRHDEFYSVYKKRKEEAGTIYKVKVACEDIVREKKNQIKNREAR